MARRAVGGSVAPGTGPDGRGELNASRQELRIQTICLLILSAIGIAFSLYFLKPVLIPFVLAMFLAIGLTPVVDVQVRRLRMPRAVAVACTLVLGVAILVLLGMVISVSIAELGDHSDDYARQADKLFRWATETLGIDPDQSATDPDATQVGPFALPARHVQTVIVATSTAVMDIASSGVLVFLCLCFLLFGGTTRMAPLLGTWGEIVRGIRNYILTKVLLSAATGVLVGGILWVLGIKLALVFGLLAFALNFIPSIGSVVATLLPLPLVLLSPDVSPVTAILAIALPGSVQFAIGNVLEPRIVGRSLDLHPIAILMVMIFWGMLWGVAGMFLAVPLTVALKILLAKHPLTAPLAGALAGRVIKEPPSDQPEAADGG